MKHQLCYRCMKPNANTAVCTYCSDNSNIPNEPHQLAAGTVLNGRYFIGRPLGQGGFGITYTGMDLQTDSRIAVKEFFPSGIVMRDTSSKVRILRAGDNSCFEKHRERFLREYQTLSGLSGIAQIVNVSDFFLENNTAYIVWPL